MDITVDREREREIREMQQQRNADRLRELAMKNRGVREEADRKRVADPRGRSLERPSIAERVVLEREEVAPERPVIAERPMLADREPKAAVVPVGRMLERDARVSERDQLRDAPPERMRGSVSREREDRTPERIRDSDDDAGNEMVIDRDLEREESLGELVSSYTSALGELTFNSKPIITNLTIIAGENTHAAKVISSTLFNHIMEVPKEQKLPSLYLLDSIVKNIGGDYVKYFAARLPEVFCTAYRQVDPTTNPAMQHLFRTWRGVFPQAPLRVIEKELQISSSTPNGQTGGTPPARPAESSVLQTGHESPMPRTGHGIHVNPKYLEAQRQRLQNSGGQMPSQGIRDEYADPDFGQVTPFDYEFDDYGVSNGANLGRKPSSDRPAERDEGWGEPEYLRDRDGEGFGREEGRSPRGRYGARNGYEWRQPATRSTDMDGYAYNRGPGPGRGGPVRPIPARGDGGEIRGESRGRGAPGTWLKAGEDDYVWEDMSPRQPHLRDERHSTDRISRDGWYPSETRRGNSVGDTSRLKRTSQEAGFADNSSWRRNGPSAVPVDQVHAAPNRRPSKEYEDRRSLQPDSGSGSGVTVMGQSAGPSRGPISIPISNAGWSHPNSIHDLSPPARTRSGNNQLSVLNNNSSRPSANLLPRAGGPSIVSNGVGPPHSSAGHFESRQVSRSSLGNFGSSSPTLNSISKVTPAPGSSFQQRQHAHRQPSPTQLSHQLHQQQIPSLPSSQPQSQQLHLQLQRDQSSQMQARHQMHITGQLQNPQSLPITGQAPGLQHPPSSQAVSSLIQSSQPSLPQAFQHLSSQQGLFVEQGGKGSATHQPPQLPGLQQAVQQPLSQLRQPQTQLPLQQFSAPGLPLISSQLAQSLQQLAAQQSQPSQQSQQPQPFQPSTAVPPHSPPVSQSQSVLIQNFASVSNGTSAGLVQSAEAQGASNTLLAAFLQSGFVPSSQSNHVVPISLPGQGRVSSAPAQPAFQGQPPLPSGPPPAQLPNSLGTASAVQGAVPGQTSSVVSTSMNQVAAFGNRFSQPPLPPGPPPGSSILGSASSASAPGGGITSSISSLLSSLVAHGVIGAPGSKSQLPAAVSSLSAGSMQPYPNYMPMGILPSTSVSSSSNITLLAAAVLPTSIPAPTATAEVGSLSPQETKEAAINLEFKQDFLRERHEFVLEALYSDFPRQCKTCGLRFKVQDEHSKHMDWHVSRNRRQKSQKKVSRKWFVSAKEWLSGTSAATSEFAPSFFAEEGGSKEENNELVAVPADENQSACALCGELFEDFYSDETDEWMYKGAVYLNIPHGASTEGLDSSALGPIVHMKCKTESAEIGTADSVDDEDGVQPELQAAGSVRMEVDGPGEDNIMPLLADNFEMPEIKEEEEDLGSRRKRTRY